MSDDVVISFTVGQAPIDAFGFGTPMYIVQHAHSANRQDGPFTALTDLTDLGFSTSDGAYVWAQTLLAQRPRPQQFLIGRRDVGDADLTASLDAIEAEAEASWYASFMEARTIADILLLAAWHETRLKIAFAQSDDTDMLDETAGNDAEDLTGAGPYNRTSLWYHDTDAEFVDGAIGAVGLGVDVEAAQPAYSHRTLVAASDVLSTAQKTALVNLNANYYATKVMTSGQSTPAYTFEGVMNSGRPIEQTVSMDWLQARLEEAGHNVFLRAPFGVPFDDSGFALFEAAFAGVFTRGLSIGHLVERTSEVTGRRTPWLDVVPLEDVSATDEAALRVRFNGEVHIGKKARRVVLNGVANL